MPSTSIEKMPKSRSKPYDPADEVSENMASLLDIAGWSCIDVSSCAARNPLAPLPDRTSTYRLTTSQITPAVPLEHASADRNSTYRLKAQTKVSGGNFTLPTVPSLPVDPNPIKAPTIDDITEAIIDGSGAFDIFMKAGTAQLDSQYNKNRIKGAEYAASYIQMMEMMMTQANLFVLKKFETEIQAKKIPYELEKIKYDMLVSANQAVATEQQAKLSEQQRLELEANGEYERMIKNANAENIENSTVLIKKQIESEVAKTKTAYVNIKLAKEKGESDRANGIAERNLIKAKAENTENNTALIKKQISDTHAKTLLLNTQITELVANGQTERALKTSQIRVQEVNARLYARQIVGFDDKDRRETYKITMDAWAVQAAEVSPNPETQVMAPLAYESTVTEALKQAGFKTTP